MTGQLAEIGYRLTGSSDLYQHDGRRPSASINFVTAHDGFTLNDLVSYNEKHNEANGEDNRDGANDNHSLELRRGRTDGRSPDHRTPRAPEAQLPGDACCCSQGVPMICGGDEISRTQQGNNNAYSQDNEITWLDWNLDDRKEELLAVHAAADRAPARAIPTSTAANSFRTARSIPPLWARKRLMVRLCRTSPGSGPTAR